MIIDIDPCATCVHKESYPNGNPCWKCIEFKENSDLEDVIISGKFYKKRIITNADRIRSMTDEELAEFFASQSKIGESWWLEWLKQEATDEHP